MRCHYHPNREATGQCEGCKIFLCQECTAESHRNVTNGTFCRQCVNKEIRRKRDAAKSDCTTFKVGAAVGVIVSIACLVSIFFFPFVSIVSEAMGVSVFVVWILILSSVGATPLTAYEFGSAFLVLRKVCGWWWRNVCRRIIPISFLAIALYVITIGFVVMIAGVASVFVAPYFLWKARRTLRETAWVETQEEPQYDYTPPPQESPTANIRANYCTNCGAKNNNNANYCIKCGKQQ